MMYKRAANKLIRKHPGQVKLYSSRAFLIRPHGYSELAFSPDKKGENRAGVSFFKITDPELITILDNLPAEEI